MWRATSPSAAAGGHRISSRSCWASMTALASKPTTRRRWKRASTSVFQEADTLLAAFHQAAPRAELGVCLTTPPNIRDGAFEANYKDRYPRWNWRQVQHRIVERQLEHFGGREGEGIFLVPTELNLDVVAGYPDNNGVHPNASVTSRSARASTPGSSRGWPPDETKSPL